MTDTKKNVPVSGGVNPVVAAVAGAMAMSNQDNQDKVKSVANTVVEKAQKLETIAKNAVDDVKNI